MHAQSGNVYAMETETNTQTLCGCGVPGCSGSQPNGTSTTIARVALVPEQRKAS